LSSAGHEVQITKFQVKLYYSTYRGTPEMMSGK